jgi:hypothetical protein
MGWNWMEIAVVGSTVASILAWIAKIRWSREYRDATEKVIQAKDAVIQSREAQIAVLSEEIAFLKDITPMKMREYIDTVQSRLSR